MLPHLLHDMFLCHKDEVLPGRLIEHLEGRGDGSIGGVVIACISKTLHKDYVANQGSKDKGKGKGKKGKTKKNHGRKAKRCAGIVSWKPICWQCCISPAAVIMRPPVEASIQKVKCYSYIHAYAAIDLNVELCESLYASQCIDMFGCTQSKV